MATKHNKHNGRVIFRDMENANIGFILCRNIDQITIENN